MLIMVVLIGGTGGTPRPIGHGRRTPRTPVPPAGTTLQHRNPWGTTGTTSPTEKLKAEDLGFWIRSMWVTAERVREGNSSKGDDR
jgi:hypothetical protein